MTLRYKMSELHSWMGFSFLIDFHCCVSICVFVRVCAVYWKTSLSVTCNTSRFICTARQEGRLEDDVCRVDGVSGLQLSLLLQDLVTSL